ncbi:MAG: hypothetical protein LBD11_00835 [Candidatus Peribacteria bacterium]|jgi:plasmid maintenance system antidote protein VapI|nr:hypothetical protein [Candidatus Peribacteria bacterium]
MQHPGILLGNTIKDQGRTQKKFAFLVGKKVSEVNELIKGKRNITIQWDYLLHNVFGDPIKYWLQMQIDYDYEQFLATENLSNRVEENISKEETFDENIIEEDVPNNIPEEIDVWDLDPSSSIDVEEVPLSKEKIIDKSTAEDNQRKEKQQIFRDF